MRTISCMNIDEKILRSFGSQTRDYDAKEFIFREGDSPISYYQIVSGTVKINNYNEDGKEFIHNILSEHQSFGDPMLFVQKTYPMNAIALTPCTIIRLPKSDFINMLNEYPKTSFEMNACLSHRLYYKLIMMQNMSSNNPQVRVTGLLDFFKSFQEDKSRFAFNVQLTRQQIADLIGLRVETVIRVLKRMEQNNIIKIENHKIFY